MNEKLHLTKKALFIGFIATIMSCTHQQKIEREIASEGIWETMKATAKKLLLDSDTRHETLSETLQNVSTAEFKPEDGYLIRNNDSAFASKIYAIRNAKKTIDLVYYIYSSDETSSYFSNELIKAANRGVKVRLLVDYIFNYSNLTYFQALQKLGQGNITISFYNQPSLMVQAFAEYLVTPCPQGQPPTGDDCKNSKWNGKIWGNNIASLSSRLNSAVSSNSKHIKNLSPEAKLFLSGFFSQNGALIHQSLRKHDLSAIQSGPALSDEEKQAALSFLKIYYRYKLKGEISAGIQYLFAMAFYGQKINPLVNNIESYFPKQLLDSKDLPYITNYTHHKLLLADNKYMQLGGRNIENSYHVSKSDLVNKYLFIDTDMFFVLNPIDNSTKEIAASFGKLWNHFSTGRLNDIEDFSNYEALAQVKKSNLKSEIASIRIKTNAYTTYLRDYLKRKANGDNDLQNMQAIYKSDLTIDTKGLFTTSGTDMVKIATNVGRYFYLENIREGRYGSSQSFGSVNLFEKKYGKNIHKVWNKSLESACRDNTPNSRVVIHNAYYSPPAEFLRTIGQQVKGTNLGRTCNGLKYEIITNSIHTTDLNPINIIARRQMKALSDYLDGDITKSKRLEYYEYSPISSQPPRSKSKKVKSLHSKVMVVKNDVFVGSANADIRSLMMDTNNGVYIQNHEQLSKEYYDYIDGLKSGTTSTIAEAQDFFQQKINAIRTNDEQIYYGMMNYFRADRFITPEQKEHFWRFTEGLLNKVTDQSVGVLRFDLQNSVPQTPNYDSYFKFDSTFKVF